VTEFLSEKKDGNQRYLKYQASLGTPLDSNGFPVAHGLLLNDPSFVTGLDLAWQNSQTVQFPLDKDSKLAQALTLGERGFGDVPNLAILSPIALHHRTVGSVFMIGINPRCPYNDEYQEFIQTIACAISSALSAVGLENETQRAQESFENEQRARVMLEASPVGSYLIRSNGEMLYANRAWFEITGHEGTISGPLTWMKSVHDGDQAKLEIEWHKLSVLKQPTSFELRMKKKWHHTDPTTGEYQTGPTYCLASATIQLFGEEEYITGAITDISQQKRAEEAQIQQKDDAISLKRAQEK
jgi:PAS domain S-box-containing protein